MVPTQIDATIAILGGVITAILAFRVPRQELDRVPLSGLVLLFMVYMLVGWALAIGQLTIGFWLGAAAIALVVTFGSSVLLGRAGLIAFVLAGIGAIALGFVRGQNADSIRWSAIVLGFVGIWLWATGGARYRMERAGFRRSTVQWVLAIVGWEGLWVGWVINTFLAPQVGTWLMQMN
ncbi:hypothetical protein LEP3755_26260 [Leptolyngbya sp. NIES-3755]|nr:hypothetical protein LEP3755_26260 [Leptolyngbya sp. NIES-3755]